MAVRSESSQPRRLVKESSMERVFLFYFSGNTAEEWKKLQRSAGLLWTNPVFSNIPDAEKSVS